MFVVLASLFMACGTPKDGYVVKGSLKNAGDGYAVISVADHTGASVIADTAEMSGGKFRFEGKTPFVAACSLRVVPEGKEVLDMLIVLENSPIKLQGDWANLERNTGGSFFIRDMKVTGGKNTEVCNLLDEVYFSTRRLPEFKDYERLEKWFASLDENAELTDEVMRKADTLQEIEDRFRELVFGKQLEIMAAHPSSEAAALYLTPMIDGMKLDEFERVFGLFDEAVRNSEMLTDIREELETRQRLAPGRIAPVFSLAQRDGQMLSLADLRSKVVLVDFWASWCGPCRASFPWMREFYKKYHDKGVEILGVGVDKDVKAWEKALDAEKLPWLHVRDAKVPGGKHMVSDLYDVTGIPHFVLIDREGKLVRCGYFEHELEELVDKLLMDKKTGNPLLVDGKEITAEKTFKANGENETVELEFTFDASALKGTTTVVFENLYEGENEIGTHADLEDEGQTVEIPEIGTTLIGKDSQIHVINADEKITLVDTVKYKGLEKGREYKVDGVLYDKETKQPLEIDGKQVTASATFTAEASEGSVDVTFVFDQSIIFVSSSQY